MLDALLLLLLLGQERVGVWMGNVGDGTDGDGWGDVWGDVVPFYMAG